MTDRRELKETLRFALAIAREAGTHVLSWYGPAGQRPEVGRKADATPVTEADRAAEALLRQRIEGRFPVDGILGEELGETRPGARRRWILDPIDGTLSFVHGVPLFGVLVALEVDGEPVLGVLRFPALRETVAAARGLGCRWNGRRVAVSTESDLRSALVVTTGGPTVGAGAELRGRLLGIERLRDAAGVFRTWGDCYGYALVATGRAEAMLDPQLSVWDAAAVRPIIEEAGGVFTDWDGVGSHETGHAVATNRSLAGPVRAVIAGGGAP